MAARAQHIRQTAPLRAGTRRAVKQKDRLARAMRVQAVWPPEAARSASPASAGARGMGLGDAVAAWKPTGEPDLTREQIAEHIL